MTWVWVALRNIICPRMVRSSIWPRKQTRNSSLHLMEVPSLYEHRSLHPRPQIAVSALRSNAFPRCLNAQVYEETRGGCSALTFDVSSMKLLLHSEMRHHIIRHTPEPVINYAPRICQVSLSGALCIRPTCISENFVRFLDGC